MNVPFTQIKCETVSTKKNHFSQSLYPIFSDISSNISKMAGEPKARGSAAGHECSRRRSVSQAGLPCQSVDGITHRRGQAHLHFFSKVAILLDTTVRVEECSLSTQQGTKASISPSSFISRNWNWDICKILIGSL